MRFRFRVDVVVAVIVTSAASLALDTRIATAHRTSDSLSADQIDNLALLGKVWGFAKYHHTAFTSGSVDADSALRQILPSVREARGHLAATKVISQWLARLPAPKQCSTCASMPESTFLRPDIGWIRDERAIGHTLSTQLAGMYRNRPSEFGQHYVQLAPSVGNPIFRNERDYSEDALADPDLRLLALYRFWNIIEYWSPNRGLIKDWDSVLREFVPRLWIAEDQDAYRLAMIALIARVGDGHANLWNALNVRPPRGSYRLPLNVRFIEDKAVVAGLSDGLVGSGSGLRVGDVISSIDGAPIDSLVATWTPYYSASNKAARVRDIAHSLTQGPSAQVRVTAERNDSTFVVHMKRVPISNADRSIGSTHDLPGDTFQQLTDEVSYLKLSSVSAAQSAEYIRQASGSKVLVIDIRNYPKEFVVFALGSHLVSRETEFVSFTIGDIANPGAFVWRKPVTLRPTSPLYGGTVVILVDETTQSQAEYTAMAFRAAPNAIVVGSTTAGADGNVSPIMLPGGLRTVISGIGVFYPDRRPTQQVGIVPDLVVRPTIAGIRQGRDEVLEAGVAKALGREFRLPPRWLH